jgi:peptidoglycan/xylan/chitin deacetylase (PgdA/CDA1 family)
MAHPFVLCFHSGNDTDYLALPEVLRWLHAEGVDIVPAVDLVSHLIAGTLHRLPASSCVLTFDDGMNLDFEDVEHPVRGWQPSFARIMADFERSTSAAEGAPSRRTVHATSFVIASPVARREIQQKELLGYPWMSDHWWATAVSSGKFHLGNHSWDHVSGSVATVAQRQQKKGDFSAIDNYADADIQVRAAREAIEAIAPSPGTSLFCYPYGQSNSYLIDEYFPNHIDQHKTVAAFDCSPKPVLRDANRWRIPRFVFGAAWTSITDLSSIVRECRRTSS